MAKQIIKIELSRGGTTREQIEWITWIENGTVREDRAQVAARLHDGEDLFYVRPDGTHAEIECYGGDFIRTKNDDSSRDRLLSLA